MNQLGLSLFGLTSALSLVGGAGWTYYLLSLQRVGAGKESVLARYTAWVEQYVRVLRLRTSAERMVQMHLLGTLGVFVLAILMQQKMIAGAGVLAAVALPVWLKREAGRRLRTIEGQLDTWLQVLANSLKASPSLGDAISYSSRIIREPLSDELDLTIKETQLGVSVERALNTMACRVDSPLLSLVVATLIVGQRTGGSLGPIIEETAGALRELQRLEGVVRKQTAMGKAQVWLMALMPLGMMWVMSSMDKRWAEVMFHTFAGQLIFTLATLFWIGAIVLARRILMVDI